MTNRRCTIIRFDVEGYYSTNIHGVLWNPEEAHIYSLFMKETLEELTYCLLVDKLYEKLRLDKNTKRLKLSYIPLQEKRHTYILDDDDLLVYMMEGDKNHQRDVLHVEVMEGVSENQNCEESRRNDQGSGMDVRIDEIVSGARVNVEMEALMTEVEPLEPCLMLGNRPHISIGENDPCEEVGDNDNNGLSLNLGVITHDVPIDEVVNLEWEDGIGMTIGQEFESKKDVHDLVDRAVHRNCFQVATLKSTTRYPSVGEYRRRSKRKSSLCTTS